MLERKRECSCQCGSMVSRTTEWRHRSGRGPRILTRQAIRDNAWVFATYQAGKRPSQPHSPDESQPLRKRSRRDEETPSPPEPQASDSFEEDVDMDRPPTPTGDGETEGHVLSTERRSAQVSSQIEQTQKLRWEKGYQGFPLQDSSDPEDQAPDNGESNDPAAFADESDLDSGGDDDLGGLIYALPGQEGIPLWDLIGGESFLQKAAALSKWIRPLFDPHN
jgi:hypothetical protein